MLMLTIPIKMTCAGNFSLLMVMMMSLVMMVSLVMMMMAMMVIMMSIMMMEDTYLPAGICA